MFTRFVQHSLRRMLVLTSLAVALSAVTIATLAIVAVDRQRVTNDQDARAFALEQRIADRITALTYQQQLDAYRALINADQQASRRFDERGDFAEAELRRYLFQALPASARLKVERMKEAHQAFEAVAHRAFELVAAGDTTLARQRLGALDADAAMLDRAVNEFLQLRQAQRTALEDQTRRVSRNVQGVLILAGAGVVLLALGLASAVTRRVLVPLEEVMVAADALRRGADDARIPPQTYSELQAVASAFNDMAEQVQTSRQTVEMQNEELRDSLDQLHDTQDELVQRERLSAMGESLAGLAHELNNPLGSVLGMAEVLGEQLKAGDPPSTEELRQTVVKPLIREARRARDLVHNLLSFSRKAVSVSEPVALAPVVRAGLAVSAQSLERAGIAVHVQVADDLVVLGDARKLQQVIINLAANALDAMRDRSGSELTIAARADESTVSLSVRDNGPGFADASAAFTPFYTTKSAERGTGLGLALVEKFTREFGGSVSARNRPEGGAEVTLVLMRAEGAEAEALLPAERTAEHVAVPRPATVRRLRVLVVDDEATLLEVQRRMLALEGVDAILASSGAEAKAIIEREVPDLVISDLRMPGDLDGRALMAWLEVQHPQLAQRSLLVTGELARTTPTGGAWPAERMLHKPFTLAEYRVRVREALAGVST